MSVKSNIAKLGLTSAFDHLYKDPEKNLRDLMDWADKFSGGLYESQRTIIRKAIEDPDDPYYPYVRHVVNDIDPEVMKTAAVNFFVNSNLKSGPVQNKLREKYNCNIPWAILMDPTSACNLQCTGCWAAEYGNKLNLSFEEMDDIINQGKELGVYMYILSGGEPLVRKKDIIRLCEKHDDCMFTAFTNGTLIDEEFADEMLRVKNFAPAISLEGFDDATDQRRGEGVYDKVIKAMKILHERKLIYGISCCYTSANYKAITSKEYLDMIAANGAYFVWYFHYMPVGMDASPELLPTPDQREYVYRQIREYRKNNPLFVIDFQNDGEYVNGCIAGGRRYLHINANGDFEPCAFVHYSDSNIREKTVLEALRSPLFQAYHDNQPFNDNLFRPCPMLENPHALKSMVEKSGSKSTDMQSPESADHLCNKCQPYADNWEERSKELWEERLEEKPSLRKNA
ncbi:radical SAM protein [Neofamilia massiliensis]|uniref:radical SAM protein n=1 Tax=Neofamilia massiliensis TaxID=1673724 RepID=UPI0006BB9656|nr:radical SAM protein [Neofamilia massiliensis]